MEILEQRVTNIESALRSQGISIPDCVQLRADVLDEECETVTVSEPPVLTEGQEPPVVVVEPATDGDDGDADS